MKNKNPVRRRRFPAWLAIMLVIVLVAVLIMAKGHWFKAQHAETPSSEVKHESAVIVPKVDFQTLTGRTRFNRVRSVNITT